MNKMTRIFFQVFFVSLLLSTYSCSTQKNVRSSKNEETEKVQLTEAQERQFNGLFMDASRAKILGNFGDALNIYKQALNINPSSSAAMYEIARIYAQDGNFPAALTYAKGAVRNNPENVWYQEFLGQLYAETGRIDESIEVFKEIIELHPEELDYYFSLGTLYSSQGRYDEALELYSSMESQFGINQELAMQRQLIYIEKGDFPAALREIDVLIEQNPDDIRLYGMKAEIFEQLGEEEKAISIYESMLFIEPNNGLVLMALYEISEKNGESQKADEYLKRAFSSPELGIDIKVNILLNFLSRPDFESNKEKVKDLAVRLEKAHSYDAKAFAIHGDLLYNLGEIEPALEKFRKAVEIDPNRPPIWQQILTIDSQLNDFNSLASESEEAIELFPQLPIFYLYNGIALIQQEKLEDAIDILNSGKNLVVEDNQILAQFYSSLGDVYHSMANHSKSDEAYDMALKIEPSNVIVLNNYAYYLSLRKVNLEKAENMAKRANDLSPNVASFQDTYGWVLYVKENYANALFWIEESIKNGSAEDPIVIEHLGDVQIKLNKTDEAINSWKRALELGGDIAILQNKIDEHSDKVE